MQTAKTSSAFTEIVPSASAFVVKDESEQSNTSEVTKHLTKPKITLEELEKMWPGIKNPTHPFHKLTKEDHPLRNLTIKDLINTLYRNPNTFTCSTEDHESYIEKLKEEWKLYFEANEYNDSRSPVEEDTGVPIELEEVNLGEFFDQKYLKKAEKSPVPSPTGTPRNQDDGATGVPIKVKEVDLGDYLGPDPNFINSPVPSPTGTPRNQDDGATGIQVEFIDLNLDG